MSALSKEACIGIKLEAGKNKLIPFDPHLTPALDENGKIFSLSDPRTKTLTPLPKGTHDILSPSISIRKEGRSTIWYFHAND